MEQIKRDTLTLADRLNRDFAKLELADRIERIGGLAYRAVFTTCMGMCSCTSQLAKRCVLNSISSCR